MIIHEDLCLGMSNICMSWMCSTFDISSHVGNRWKTGNENKVLSLSKGRHVDLETLGSDCWRYRSEIKLEWDDDFQPSHDFQHFLP